MAGNLRQLGDALDTEHAAGEFGEQRRLIAISGADLENRVLRLEVQGLDHQSDQRRL